MCSAERTVGGSPGPATHPLADLGQASPDGARSCSGKERDKALLHYQAVRDK